MVKWLHIAYTETRNVRNILKFKYKKLGELYKKWNDSGQTYNSIQGLCYDGSRTLKGG